MDILTEAQLKEKLAHVPKAMAPEVKKGMRVACLVVVAQAKKNCTPGISPYAGMTFPSKLAKNPEADGAPFDTGRLRASITYKVDYSEQKVRGRVGTNVDYAPGVHEGTSKMEARPFILDAVIKKKPEVLEILRRCVINACLDECEMGGVTYMGRTPAEMGFDLGEDDGGGE